MTMFAVVSDLKGNTSLILSIARCCFLSRNQFIFGIDTELSPVLHSIAGWNPRVIQGDGLVSENKETVLGTFPTVLIHPEHVGNFLQLHSLRQVVVLHDSCHHLEELSKVTSALELT